MFGVGYTHARIFPHQLYSYSFFLDGHFGCLPRLCILGTITFHANTSGNGPLDGRLVCVDSR